MWQRRGARNVGYEYEPKVSVYLAIALSQNQDVEDYSLHTGLKSIPGFDDLVIRVQYKNKKHPNIYLIQIKHRAVDMNFDIEKYQLHDYKGCINQIIGRKDYIDFLNVPEENIEFWLFCTKFIAGSVNRDGKTSLRKSICECISTLDLPGCYQFRDNYKSICHSNFYFYLRQPDNWRIETYIRDFYQEEFSSENTRNIISFVDRYFNRTDKKIPWLTKNIFETEILNIHLRNVIVKPTIPSTMYKNVTPIWNKLVMTHEITIVEDLEYVESSIFGCILENITTCVNNFQWNDYTSTDSKQKSEYIENLNFQQVHSAHLSDTLESLFLELWKTDKLPLVIKSTNSISILNKYKHLGKRFIIIGDVKETYNQVKDTFSLIFTNAGNINSIDLKCDLVKNLKISLQGRKPVALSHIIDNDSKSLYEMSCSTILYLFRERHPRDKIRYSNILVDNYGDNVYYFEDKCIPIVGQRLDTNDSKHIERWISTATLSESIFDNPQGNRIFLLTGDIKSLRSNRKHQILDQLNSSRITPNLKLENERDLLFHIDENDLEVNWRNYSRTQCNVLHIQVKGGIMQLIKCRNYVDVKKYISYNEKLFKEGDFFEEINDKVTIVSGEPGIGKSTLLRSLFQIVNERNYTLFADLADYHYHIHENTKELFDNPLNFIFKQSNSSKFPKFLEAIYNYHSSKRKITLFLDSFDEMLPSESEKVMSLIDKVTTSNVNVIISSRLNADSILRKRFKVLPFRIENLTIQDYEAYFEEKYLMNSIFTKQFFENPLHLTFFDQKGLCLYSNALNAKVKTYCQKNKYCLAPIEINMTYHKLLALVYLLGKDEAITYGIIENYEAIVEKFKIYEIKLGIISYFDEHNLPVFVHRMFADYLALEWLNENSKKFANNNLEAIKRNNVIAHIFKNIHFYPTDINENIALSDDQEVLTEFMNAQQVETFMSHLYSVGSAYHIHYNLL